MAERPSLPGRMSRPGDLRLRRSGSRGGCRKMGEARAKANFGSRPQGPRSPKIVASQTTLVVISPGQLSSLGAPIHPTLRRGLGLTRARPTNRVSRTPSRPSAPGRTTPRPRRPSRPGRDRRFAGEPAAHAPHRQAAWLSPRGAPTAHLRTAGPMATRSAEHHPQIHRLRETPKRVDGSD
jgi:hypothetical protein